MIAAKIKSLPMGKDKLYTLMNYSFRRKISGLSGGTERKGYMISGMNVNTDPGQIDPSVLRTFLLLSDYTQPHENILVTKVTWFPFLAFYSIEFKK